MHGRSLAWVRDACQVEGAGRALLYALAAFADRHHGACTASYRTLAVAAGGKPRWTIEMLHRFVDGGILECLEPGAGRRPACYRFNPDLIGSGQPTSPQDEPRSGAPSAPQASSVVVHSQPRSGAVPDPVVVQSPFRSGAVPPSLTSTDGRQEKNLEEKSFEDSAFRAPGGREVAGRARPDGRPTDVPPSDWAEVSAAARAGKIPDWLVDMVIGEVDEDAELKTSHDGSQFILLSNGTVVPNARQALAICSRAAP